MRLERHANLVAWAFLWAHEAAVLLRLLAVVEFNEGVRVEAVRFLPHLTRGLRHANLAHIGREKALDARLDNVAVLCTFCVGLVNLSPLLHLALRVVAETCHLLRRERLPRTARAEVPRSHRLRAKLRLALLSGCLDFCEALRSPRRRQHLLDRTRRFFRLSETFNRLGKRTRLRARLHFGFTLCV